MKWFSDRIIDYTKQIGRLKIHFSWRSKDSFTGRFGGGWQWSLGFKYAKHDLILSFLFCELRISWKKK